MIRFPPKKILVPLDLTDASLSGWRHAEVLAKRFGASLEALYTEDLVPAGDPWSLRIPRMTDELKKEILKHIRSKIGSRHKIHISEGDALVTILRLARSAKPDLIVMGTHGRQGFDRFWSGSVTEAVVRLSPVPVLAVHEGPPRPIRSILAPVNFADYSEYGFTFAAGAAAAMKASVTAIHVTADPEKCANPDFRLSGMVYRLPAPIRKACKAKVLLRTGEPTEEILRAAQGHDLLVVVAHRKSLLKDFVLGTTAERVLRYSPIPVLAVPSPRTSVQWQRWVKTFEARAA